MSEPSHTWEQAVQWLREQADQEELVRACYFDDPLGEAAERFWQSGEWRAVRELLPPAGGKALDLGAGRGISSFALAKDGWEVTALEPDPSELVGAGAIRRLAQETALAIQVVEEYSERLPFGDESFDLVHARQALHHADDLPAFCSEAARVLKPGGLFMATREHVISRREDLEAFLASHPLHSLYGGENAFLLEEYCAAIQGAGLSLDRVLGTYDSQINYFPASKKQIEDSLRQVLAAKIGRLPAAALLSERHPVGPWLCRRLNLLRSKREHTPGRLFSFLAHKQ